MSLATTTSLWFPVDPKQAKVYSSFLYMLQLAQW